MSEVSTLTTLDEHTKDLIYYLVKTLVHAPYYSLVVHFLEYSTTGNTVGTSSSGPMSGHT